MRGLLLLAILTLGLANAARGRESSIVKVLPHLLDQKGRHTLSPSLFERDAYQKYLRDHPGECDALRFDIQWRADVDPGTPLRLRIEVMGSQEHVEEPLMIQSPVLRKGRFSQWNDLGLDSASFRRIGKIMAWRVTLWNEDRLMAEQQSFLWVKQTQIPPAASPPAQ